MLISLKNNISLTLDLVCGSKINTCSVLGAAPIFDSVVCLRMGDQLKIDEKMNESSSLSQSVLKFSLALISSLDESSDRGSKDYSTGNT